MHIMDGVIEIIVGVIGFGIIVAFIAGMNQSQMTSSELLILGVIPVFFLLMILYGIFRMVRGGGTRGRGAGI